MSDQPQPYLPQWDARLRHIYISAGHDYWGRQGEGRMQHGVSSPEEVECVAGKGLRGGLRARVITSGILRVGLSTRTGAI